MTDDKKKGDFAKKGKDDTGGNKKQDNSDKTPSRTSQNAGHGGRR